MSAPLEFLFDASLIPKSVQQQLGPDLELRPLASSDHTRGHLELLRVLTVAPDLPEDQYTETFNSLKSTQNTYYTIVIVHKATDKVVGCGTIVIERKFLRSAGQIGHIEDIAVSQKMQGRKLGLRIINSLEKIGESLGCYKIILDCSKENIPFYEKCGFKHKEYEMVRYIPQNSPRSAKL